MKNGQCPKCGANEIYRQTHEGYSGINRLAIAPFSQVSLDIYACLNCGYIETYLPDQHKNDEIKTKWEKVGEPPPP